MNMNDNSKEPLNLENTMWSNTILTNGKILGLVIFVGKETKSVLNSRKPKTKVYLNNLILI